MLHGVGKIKKKIRMNVLQPTPKPKFGIRGILSHFLYFVGRENIVQRT